MAYTLLDVEERIFDELSRTTEQYDARLTANAIYRAYNDARDYIANICKCTPYGLFVDNIIAYKSIYNLDASNPPLRDVRWVGYAVSGKPSKLTPVTRPNDIISRGLTDTGTPRYYTKNGSSLFIYPSSTTDVPDSLYIYARAMPKKIYNTQDVSELPEYVDNMAILRASIKLLSGRLAEETASLSKVQMKMALWKNDFPSFMRKVDEENSHSMVQVSDPGELYLSAMKL